ncbi:DUF2218 domain-containing protein [Actinoallomurus sp. NPDC050550]|uniref:DUF2218 domain-containing protein n=1 Tax=Actinoallomurus sp. NPDC050550 TaxID=3154937 RepID=UPI0033C8F1D6
MLTSEIALQIDRPSRYLVQLCRHAAAMGETRGGHRPRPHATGAALARGDLRVHAEHSDTHGVITIAPWGQVTLDATDDTLTLRVDATDQDALQRIQDIVTRDLERFGRRDQIALTWPPPTTSSGEITTANGAGESSAGPATAARHSRRNTILLTALIVVAVAVHLGLGGTVLANSRWTSLSIDVVLAIVAGKILLVILGRHAFRRRHIPHPGAHLRIRRPGHGPNRDTLASHAAPEEDHHLPAADRH